MKSGGQFLRQDRGAYQRDGFDRRRDVAHGIDALIGGCEIDRLANDGAAYIAHHATQRVEIGHGAIAGDGAQLVERAAGVAQAPPRDHRHEHQAHLVADATGGMFVEDRTKPVPMQHRPRIGHGAGQRHALVEGHAAEEHRHSKGRNLTLADAAARDSANEERDFLLAQLMAVALFADEFLRKHRVLSL